MVETLNANVSLEKTRIISILKQKGPSVANAISKSLNLPNLLTSAILSEMTAEKVLKASNLKIGGSPLYYIPGQELALESFLNHLEGKEREAFTKLKDAGVLIDIELDPAIRVALRNIKDYAIPLKVNVGDEDKIIWKYALLKNEDAEEKLNELFEKKKEVEVKAEIKVEKKVEKKEEKAEENKGNVEKIKEERPKIKERKKKSKVDLRGFAEKWINKNKAELKQEIPEKGFIVSIPSEIGKLDFLLLVRNKKLSEGDLAMAHQEGLSQKLPVIILYKRKPSKKVIEYAASFRGYLVLKEYE